MRLRSRLEFGRWLVFGHTHPLSDHWGYDRGTPVDRWYIERWLSGQARDIRGSVLEAMDSRYTARFGTGVTESARRHSGAPEAAAKASFRGQRMIGHAVCLICSGPHR